MLKFTRVIPSCLMISFLSIFFLFQSLQQAQDNSGMFIHLNNNDLSNNLKVKDKINKILKRDGIENYYLVSLKDADNLHDFKSLKVNIDERQVEMRVKRIKKNENNELYIYAENNEYGFLALTKCEKGYLGFIQNGSEGYLLDPLDDGVHIITKLDMKKRADREKDFLDYKIKESIPKVPQLLYQAESISTINIIIAYTYNAKNDCPDNVRDWARNAVWEAEVTYSNSGIPIDLNLVYLYLTPYTESGLIQTDLNRFTFQNDGFMDEIHTLRQQYRADICVLMVADNDEANGMVNNIPANDYHEAFLLVNYDAASSQWSLAHELGHLIGVRHQYPSDPYTAPLKYGHGYVKDVSAGRWRTILGIYSEKYRQGYGPRIPYYSTPYMTYGDLPLGNRDSADNVRALRERAWMAANFLSKENINTQNLTEENFKYQLMQNYPNPFNPHSMIAYSLQRDCFVTLKIFNILGREISSLVKSFQTSGNYKVNFDGSNLPSGIYFYRLDAEEFSSTRKFILLK